MSMRSFHLDVVTPDGAIYSGEVESLLVRTDTGDIEFLAGHIDYIASLGTGRARIREGGRDRYASVSGGTIQISGGKASLVAVTFEFKENIDIERARAAKSRAEEKIKAAKSDRELVLAKARLERAISRIKVYELK